MIIFMMEVMIMEGEVMIEMISMITLSTIVLVADYDYFDDYLPREAIARRKRRSAEGARFAAHCYSFLNVFNQPNEKRAVSVI